ncbi:uncharacterized protein LOC106154699 [Lingula anatina]|uniref:Uncharacterized protein LOC106154699 n=1 Tax=Lingula anatina TaxID=7574 RepID=A0A1S3HEW1_LINAN|nr:uncharacterized protein LOC106154699 [Lingula anatina]|eukprot:XP_013384603.1 uncharacterized protein LOC106154699 [Lingula anatina]
MSRKSELIKFVRDGLDETIHDDGKALSAALVESSNEWVKLDERWPALENLWQYLGTSVVEEFEERNRWSKSAVDWSEKVIEWMSKLMKIITALQIPCSAVQDTALINQALADMRKAVDINTKEGLTVTLGKISESARLHSNASDKIRGLSADFVVVTYMQFLPFLGNLSDVAVRLEDVVKDCKEPLKRDVHYENLQELVWDLREIKNNADALQEESKSNVERVEMLYEMCNDAGRVRLCEAFSRISQNRTSSTSNPGRRRNGREARSLPAPRFFSNWIFRGNRKRSIAGTSKKRSFSKP